MDTEENVYFSIPSPIFYGTGQEQKMARINSVRKRIGQSPEKVKTNRKRPASSESSELSENENSDVCDDDELDDVNPYHVPQHNDPENANETCGLCGEQGKNELWYRCVSCGLWYHAECTAADSPGNLFATSVNKSYFSYKICNNFYYLSNFPAFHNQLRIISHRCASFPKLRVSLPL